MNYQFYFWLFSMIVFVAYNAYIIIKYGMQDSVSATYYNLSLRDRWLFSLFIWGFALPLGIAGSTPLMVAGAMVLCFVGSAPAFRNDKMELDVHMAGTIGGIALAFASLLFEHKYWFLVVIFAAGSVYIRYKWKHYTLYVEWLAYLLIAVGVLLAIR